MCVVMIVVMIESTGMFLALGEMTGKTIGQKELAAGLRADGVGTIIGAVFNAFAYTSFSQNVGLVGVTGVRSRYVTAAGGGILIVLSLIPKLAALVGAIPVEVLGGAGLVMFGMVAATGVRILSGVDFKNNRNNLFIVAIAVAFGLLTLISSAFFKNFPVALKPILDSGIILTTIVAVALNAYYNGLGSQGAVEGQLAEPLAPPITSGVGACAEERGSSARRIAGAFAPHRLYVDFMSTGGFPRRERGIEPLGAYGSSSFARTRAILGRADDGAARRTRHQRLSSRQRPRSRRHSGSSRAGRHPHGLVSERLRRRSARQIRHCAFS